MYFEKLHMESILASFILGITAIVLLYWYATQKRSYWKERRIPYVKSVPILGIFLETLNKPLWEVETERYKKYGKVYGHYQFRSPAISVADPVHLRNILIKDFQSFTSRQKFQTGDKIFDNNVSLLTGEDWKRVRAIITPTFTTRNMKRMLGIFKECSKTCAQKYLKFAKEGKPVDLKKIYGAFIMDTIASAAFSTKIDSHNDPNNKFVTAATNLFTMSFSWRIVLFFLFPGLLRWLRISLFHPSAMTFFKNVTLDIIKERKRTGQTRNDFLQLLLDTAKEVQHQGKSEVDDKEDIAENYVKQETSNQIFKNISKKSLSHEELVAQCIVFFLAGYETTTNTLSFISYLLALNTDIQEKLAAEVDETIRASNGEMTYDAVQNMKYMDNVISETLRLYSPAVRFERLADENYKLGDTGITILKDMMVTIPICAMHRDPELFPDPEEFDPDRFSPEERAKRNPFIFMPFGTGPRNCIGMRFALMQIKVCLAAVLSQFRMKRCPETKVPLEFHTGQAPILQPKDVTVQMEVRKDAVAVK